MDLYSRGQRIFSRCLLSCGLLAAAILVFSVILPQGYFLAYAAYVKAIPSVGGPTVKGRKLLKVF
jgi:hypothetical protein